MFGVADVIRAYTFGVEILTPTPTAWSPLWVVLGRTNGEVMQWWSLDMAPLFISLATRYQTQAEAEAHESDGSVRTKMGSTDYISL